MLYGAARKSHERKNARESKQRERANVRRGAFEKMQSTHAKYKRVKTAQWNAAELMAHIQTAKSIFWIAVYAVPTLAMVTGLLRFILWII